LERSLPRWRKGGSAIWGTSQSRRFQTSPLSIPCRSKSGRCHGCGLVHLALSGRYSGTVDSISARMVGQCGPLERNAANGRVVTSFAWEGRLTRFQIRPNRTYRLPSKELAPNPQHNSPVRRLEDALESQQLNLTGISFHGHGRCRINPPNLQAHIDFTLKRRKVSGPRPSHESPHFLKGSCWPYFAAKS
jgi:hypothetical protein